MKTRIQPEMRKRIIKEHLKSWRKGPAIIRIEKPTNVQRARAIGYKAKQGVVVVRVRVRKGGRRKSRPSLGRKPKRMGVRKLTPRKNLQLIAEQRAARRFPNLEVFNSYHTASGGTHEFFEVILLDPNHPVVRNDPGLGWIADRQHRGRVFRGLTRAGRKSRGLLKKGKGAERLRPSVRARGRTQ